MIKLLCFFLFGRCLSLCLIQTKKTTVVLLLKKVLLDKLIFSCIFKHLSFLNVFLRMCVQKIQEHVHFFSYILNVVLYRAYSLYDMHCMYYNVQFCLSDWSWHKFAPTSINTAAAELFLWCSLYFQWLLLFVSIHRSVKEVTNGRWSQGHWSQDQVAASSNLSAGSWVGLVKLQNEWATAGEVDKIEQIYGNVLTYTRNN